MAGRRLEPLPAFDAGDKSAFWFPSSTAAPHLCAIMGGMNLLTLAARDFHSSADMDEDLFTPLRAMGLATALLGAAALGVFLGRELRFRYKFSHRTPSDFFSNAGDPIAPAEYGVGV